MTGKAIAKAHNTNENSVTHIAKRFVEEGLEAALVPKPQEGYERWSIRLLRDEIIRLEIADIERSSINNILKKMNSSRGV